MLRANRIHGAKTEKGKDYQQPSSWVEITTIDAHTAGEPLRIVTGGFPDIFGKTLLEKRVYFKKNLDHFKTRLMFEPRGYADMYGAIITEKVTEDSDFGVMFIHNEGLSSMCGHGIIALTKVVLDTGFIRKTGERPVLKIDTPAGRVTSVGHRENGLVKKVSFENVPSFVYKKDLDIEVPDLGMLRLDIAFGGAFYAFVDADSIGLVLDHTNYDSLIEMGRKIKKAVVEQVSIEHPFKEDRSFLYGTIFIGSPHDPLTEGFIFR